MGYFSAVIPAQAGIHFWISATVFEYLFLRVSDGFPPAREWRLLEVIMGWIGKVCVEICRSEWGCGEVVWKTRFVFQTTFLYLWYSWAKPTLRVVALVGEWRYRGFCLHSLYFLKCRSRSGDVGAVAWALPTNNDCLKHKKVVWKLGFRRLF